MFFWKKNKRASGIVLVILIVSLILPFSFFGRTSAAPTSLTRKWVGYVAGGGEGLLTADVRSDIPGEEVFHAGGPVAPNSGGRVTCLNGRTGERIWTRTINNIGDTCQIHMVDMDNNGDLEIVVPLQQPAGLYILHAENGNTMFSVTNVGGGRIDSSPVSGDVDNDGYPDLFIGIMGYEGVEPINGKVIRYEWNPSTSRVVERDRVTVWHPCAGGLSLCDTDNDGRIELYMNERDVYFGDGSWGRGIVSFWADTLEVRWQVYHWGASSNIPMLADVNRDGILDVVTTDLSRSVCVLNSSNGRPLTNYAGTVLMGSHSERRNHYQSSIFDFDGDGNLEIVSGDGFESRYDFVTVFDLWSWTLDAKIDTTIAGGRSWKGPTFGEVTGDGQMDMVVVTFDHINNGNAGTLQVYNRNYELVYLNAGLRHRAIDAVVQDLDKNDGGLNEILVLTQGGVIYCFETPGRASVPRARSEVQFYSERRNGVSEYIAYERPVTSPPPVDPPSPVNSAPTQNQPSLSGSTTLDNLVVTPQGTYDADGDEVINIYNWQKNGVSLANLNLPFETRTDPQDEYSALAKTKDYAFGVLGSIFGASWTPNGKVGGAYSFDGNDFIRVEESNNRYDGGGSWSEMSLECWVKATSTTSTERLIVKTDRYDRDTSYRLDYRNTGNRLEFTWIIGTSSSTYTLGPYYVTSGINNWHHVFCSYRSGVGLRLYVDGVQVSSLLGASYSGNIRNTNGPFEIAFGSGRDFLGLVDEVRLYPFAVSASMVAQRYADTKDGLSGSSTINSADTAVGEQWRCQVTPNDGKVDGATANTVTRTIVSGTGYSLTVNTVGSGSVTKNPDASSYASGAVVTLTAVPALGWSFTGWSGDLTGNANPATIIMSSSKVVTAIFTENPPSEYSLSINTVGSGSVAKSPSQVSYTSGTVVTLTAIPAVDWSFSGWGGALSGTSNPATVIMDSNKAVTATFTQTPSEHLFKDDFETGSLALWDGADGGTTISTASPYQGAYHLTCSLTSGANNGWRGVYKHIAPTNPIHLNAYVRFNAPPNTDNEDQWVLAFTQNTAANALAYAGIRQESGTLYWAIWYYSGTGLTYQVSSAVYTSGWHNLELSLFRGTANNGWVEFYVDGNLVCSASNLDNDARALNYARVGFSYSDAPSSSSSTIYIDNVVIDDGTSMIPPVTQYTLSVHTVGGGSVTKIPPQTLYDSGSIVTLTAVPNDGYQFVGWSGDLTGSINPATLTMNADKSVTATFVQLPNDHFLEDNFESGNLALWDGQESDVSVSTVNPHQGVYHLTCSLASGVNNRWSGVYKSISTTNPVYLSAYVQFNAPPNTDSEDQWVLSFNQYSSADALAYAGVRQVGGTLYWTIWYISSGTTLTHQVSSSVYTPDWHNLRLGVYRGTANDGWVEFYVDEALVCSAYNLDNDARALNFARVGFSYSDASSNTASTVYIDEVKIDT